MPILNHSKIAGPMLALGALIGLAHTANAQAPAPAPAAPAAPAAAATNLIEHSYEHRFQLDMRVPDAALATSVLAGPTLQTAAAVTHNGLPGPMARWADALVAATLRALARP